MKSLMAISILIFTASSFADTTSANDKHIKCGPGIYCVEEMLCIARIDGTPPETMNPNFYIQLVTLRSGKMLRTDGSYTDTVLMNSVPIGRDFPYITMKDAKARVDWTTGNDGPAAQLNGKHVTTNWTSTGFSNGLSLTIVESQPLGLNRYDKLNGSELIENQTIGNYKMNYECEALVVDTPSLVIHEEK